MNTVVLSRHTYNNANCNKSKVVIYRHYCYFSLIQYRGLLPAWRCYAAAGHVGHHQFTYGTTTISSLLNSVGDQFSSLSVILWSYQNVQNSRKAPAESCKVFILSVIHISLIEQPSITTLTILRFCFWAMYCFSFWTSSVEFIWYDILRVSKTSHRLCKCIIYFSNMYVI